MAKYNKYNPITEVTVRYDMAKQLFKDASGMSFKHGLDDLPDYFKTRNTGVVKGYFEDHEGTHTIAFPAYKDAWDRIWLVLSHPLAISNDQHDFTWQNFDATILELLK